MARFTVMLALILLGGVSAVRADDLTADQARRNAVQFEASVAASRRVLHAWLAHADPRTLLLPDRVAGGAQTPKTRVYTPHNSGADLYRLSRDGGETLERLGSELIEGIPMVPGVCRVAAV